jgi:cation diffusion facilitator family transporter
MDHLAVLGRRVALASIFLSAALAASKITIGLMAGSTAVVSDGFESAGDVLASSMVYFGLLVAAKPPDREHPYGHGRFEILTGLWVGILLCVTGVLVCYRSIEHLHDTALPPRAYAIWPMLASIVLKTVSWWFKRLYGKKMRSESLLADGWNDAVDILSGATALLALSITLLDPRRFASADQIGGFAVGLIVVFLGLRVSRDTTLQLMDTMPDPPMMKEIREAAMSVPGAMGVEKCFARKTGLTYHVDLHLEVDPALTVAASHAIAKEVKNRIKQRLDWVADVLVHVEPHWDSW